MAQIIHAGYYSCMKLNTHKNIVKLVLMATLACLFVTACASDEESPEQQVRNTLQAIELAVEERSTSDLMDHIADDYSDHQGNNKEAIKRLVQILFLRNQSINIFTLVRSFDISDGIAAVELSAAMASRGVDLNLQENRLKADTSGFSIVLQQTGDEWLVQSVSWQRGWGGQ